MYSAKSDFVTTNADYAFRNATRDFVRIPGDGTVVCGAGVGADVEVVVGTIAGAARHIRSVSTRVSTFLAPV